jgi:hypothetical protein
MPLLNNFWNPSGYKYFDLQIEKFRQLASEYKKANVEYYGEYLSSILFDEE